MLDCPVQLMLGDSTRLPVFTAPFPMPGSYAAPQSPVGQKTAAFGEEDTLATCKEGSVAPHEVPHAPAVFPHAEPLTNQVLASAPFAPALVTDQAPFAPAYPLAKHPDAHPFENVSDQNWALLSLLRNKVKSSMIMMRESLDDIFKEGCFKPQHCKNTLYMSYNKFNYL